MRFFFYGTLTHEHDNALTRVILPLLGPGQRASVRGRLHAVRDAEGWYPVLTAGRGEVHGWLYEAGPGFGPRALRMLDAYEAFDPRRPAVSEYLRRAVQVRLAGGGTARAQVYRYNRPLHSGLRAVPCGDFTGFAAAHGLHAFGGRRFRPPGLRC